MKKYFHLRLFRHGRIAILYAEGNSLLNGQQMEKNLFNKSLRNNFRGKGELFSLKIKSAQPKLRTKNASSICCDTSVSSTMNWVCETRACIFTIVKTAHLTHCRDIHLCRNNIVPQISAFVNT